MPKQIQVSMTITVPDETDAKQATDFLDNYLFHGGFRSLRVTNPLYGKTIENVKPEYILSGFNGGEDED